MSEVLTSPAAHESRLVDLMPFISGQKRIPATTTLKVADVFHKKTQERSAGCRTNHG